MNRKVLRRLRACGAIALGVLLVGAAAPTHAATPGQPVMDNAEWTGKVDSVVDRLRDAAKGDANFAAIKLDARRQTVVVYRKHGGAAAAYDAARGSAPAGVRVEFADAPLNEIESRQLIDLVHTRKPALTRRGITVNAITSEFDGPVTIRVQELTDEARKLPNEFTSYGPGTVVVEQGEPVTAASGRAFDVSPFVAGEYTNSAVRSDGRFAKCTSGFTGRSAGNGARYMITAYHCVDPADARLWTSDRFGAAGGSLIGTAFTLDKSHDIAYVKVTGGSTVPQIWDGGNPDAPFLKLVTAMRKPGIGTTHLCTSGAYSGARCYATVNGSGIFRINSGIESYDAFLFWADSNDGTSMAGVGDSGGPVFDPNGSTVTALGMISAVGSNNATCTGHATLCSTRVFFTDVFTEAWLNHDIDMTR